VKFLKAGTYIFLVALLALCATLPVLHSHLRSQISKLMESEQRERDAILNSIYFVMSNDVSKDHKTVFSDFINMPHIRQSLDRLYVFSRTNQIVFSSDPSKIGTFNTDPPVGRTYMTHEMALEDQRKKHLWLVKPILNKEQCIQCHEKERKILFVLSVGLKELESMDSEARLSDAFNSAVPIALVGAVVFSILCYGLARKVRL